MSNHNNHRIRRQLVTQEMVEDWGFATMAEAKEDAQEYGWDVVESYKGNFRWYFPEDGEQIPSYVAR